jgi:TfoX/Sxy family transcriptional regulator of competence genes
VLMLQRNRLNRHLVYIIKKHLMDKLGAWTIHGQIYAKVLSKNLIFLTKKGNTSLRKKRANKTFIHNRYQPKGE